jgi:trigger factor
MEVVREDIDKLNAKISITISKEDYEKPWMDELKKTRSKAQLKGFRKGKTPIGFIKKMYGQGLLAETVNTLLQKQMGTYLEEQKIETLGQPIPSEDQAQFDFDLKNLDDFVFKFDIGVAPEFNVVGVTTDNAFDKMKVIIEDKMLDDEIDLARRRSGEQIEIEDSIEDKDIITINATELGEDGKVKEAAWESTFGIMVELIVDEKLKKDVLSKKKGETISFDIYNLEKDKDEEYVKKYYLHMDENNEREVNTKFQGVIDKVTRSKPAELNQEFFDKAYGPDKVKSEEEARAFIKEDLGKYFDRQATALLYRSIQDDLLEKNPLDLPEEFLKRWLKSFNENVGDEEFNTEFGKFTENMKWSLIKKKLSSQFEVEVQPEEIQNHFIGQVRQYMGQYGMDDAFLAQTAQRLMQDQEQVNRVYEEILSEKIFAKVGEKIAVNDKDISVEDFNAAIKEANESLKG